MSIFARNPENLWFRTVPNVIESKLELHLLAQPKLVLRIAEAHAAAGGWQHFNGCLLASRTSPYFVAVVLEERSKFPQRQQNSAGPCQLGSQRETRGPSAAVAPQGTCGIGVRVGPRVNGPFWSTCKDTDAPSILRSAAGGRQEC